jgi:CspA family cold shock protein|tara:strand:- start:124 stop:390 length:267 start_codon:yes stop_codon:yes gene_type:complete
LVYIKVIKCYNKYIEEKETNKLMQGKIKWFNPTRGYGFITPDEGDKDVFIHVSALEEANITELQEGETVQFELGENRGKTTAINVVKG